MVRDGIERNKLDKERDRETLAETNRMMDREGQNYRIPYPSLTNSSLRT